LFGTTSGSRLAEVETPVAAETHRRGRGRTHRENEPKGPRTGDRSPTRRTGPGTAVSTWSTRTATTKVGSRVRLRTKSIPPGNLNSENADVTRPGRVGSSHFSADDHLSNW